MVYRYILTISKHQKLDFVHESDLQTVYIQFCMRFPNWHNQIIGVEAHGLYRQLHMHCVGYSRRMLHFTKSSLSFGDGFYAHLERITTIDPDVYDYIQKNDGNIYQREQICAQNYANHHNLFISERGNERERLLRRANVPQF